MGTDDIVRTRARVRVEGTQCTENLNISKKHPNSNKIPQNPPNNAPQSLLKWSPRLQKSSRKPSKYEERQIAATRAGQTAKLPN